ncbi:hypothetical protein [Streptomyces fractus]|uniref:hypothetical protein n=1 Tax=Streptomyces fractus TaxID=641806 RepID=UPI003CF9CC3B
MIAFDLTCLTRDQLTAALYASDRYARPVVPLGELRVSAAQGVERLGVELDESARRLGGFIWMRTLGLATPELVADHESRFPAGWRLSWAMDAALTLWRSFESIRPRAVTREQLVTPPRPIIDHCPCQGSGWVTATVPGFLTRQACPAHGTGVAVAA